MLSRNPLVRAAVHRTDLQREIALSLSILGDPVGILLPVGWLANSVNQGDGAVARISLCGLLVPGAIVPGCSPCRMCSGDWQHVDANAAAERRPLKIFLLALLVAGGAIACRYFMGSPTTMAC